MDGLGEVAAMVVEVQEENLHPASLQLDANAADLQSPKGSRKCDICSSSVSEIPVDIQGRVGCVGGSSLS